MHLRGPMTDDPAPRGGIAGFPTGLTWYQHHRAARVVASASTDAADCALLLAALGIHPGDGLRIPASMTTTVVPGYVNAAGLVRSIRVRRAGPLDGLAPAVGAGH